MQQQRNCHGLFLLLICTCSALLAPLSATAQDGFATLHHDMQLASINEMTVTAGRRRSSSGKFSLVTLIGYCRSLIGDGEMSSQARAALLNMAGNSDYKSSDRIYAYRMYLDGIVAWVEQHQGLVPMEREQALRSEAGRLIQQGFDYLYNRVVEVIRRSDGRDRKRQEALRRFSLHVRFWQNVAQMTLFDSIDPAMRLALAAGYIQEESKYTLAPTATVEDLPVSVMPERLFVQLPGEARASIFRYVQALFLYVDILGEGRGATHGLDAMIEPTEPRLDFAQERHEMLRLLFTALLHPDFAKYHFPILDYLIIEQRYSVATLLEVFETISEGRGIRPFRDNVSLTRHRAGIVVEMLKPLVEEAKKLGGGNEISSNRYRMLVANSQLASDSPATDGLLHRWRVTRELRIWQDILAIRKLYPTRLDYDLTHAPYWSEAALVISDTLQRRLLISEAGLQLLDRKGVDPATLLRPQRYRTTDAQGHATVTTSEIQVYSTVDALGLLAHHQRSSALRVFRPK